MKNLSIVFLLIAAFAFTSFSQTGRWADEEFAVEATYRHADAKFQTPTGVSQFGLADPRNSAGFRVGYTHFFGRENGRGNFGIGVEGGATFSNTEGATVDGGNIAIGRAQYKLVLQDNRPDKSVRFGVKGTVGAAREQFKNKAVPGAGGSVVASRGANAWTYGGGAFIDFGKKRKRLRLGLEYYRSIYLKQSPAFPERSNKHNFEASVGLAF